MGLSYSYEEIWEAMGGRRLGTEYLMFIYLHGRLLRGEGVGLDVEFRIMRFERCQQRVCVIAAGRLTEEFICKPS